ncbi:MAG: hypothetical protein GY702_14700 [Desulfobulbaceae bacterium]|nr:hypothetical protein [Desulfobulbaceae bacterium]
MDESTQGIIIFGLINVVSALLWHTFVRIFFLAVVGAAVTTTVTFLAAAYIQAGYLDPFFEIAIYVSGVISLAASVAIGVPFYIKRSTND